LITTDQETAFLEIKSPALAAGAYQVTKTVMHPSIDASPPIRASESGHRKPIDFSNITPRRLHAYIDEMVISERMDVSDASALFGSIPSQWYSQQPDVPMDLTSNIKGIMEFARDNGFKPLAAFYAGLMDRMRLMEAQGLPIAVVA
jgi:hypothetical protein